MASWRCQCQCRRAMRRVQLPGIMYDIGVGSDAAQLIVFRAGKQT